MKKRILVAGLIIFITGFLLSAFLISRQEPAPARQPVPTPIISPPEFPRLPIKTLQYAAPTGLSFPSALQRYSFEIELLEDLAEDIAHRLGFGGEPKRLEDISGSRLFWTKGDSVVSFGGKLTTMSYISGVPTTKQLEPGFSSIVEAESINFLGNLLDLNNKGYSARLVDQLYLQPTSTELNYVTDPTTATAVELFLQFELPEGPVFPLYAGAHGARIIYNSDLEILKAEVIIPPFPTKVDGIDAIVSYDGAVNKLRSGQGVLVSYKKVANNQKGYEQVSLYTSNVESVDLGYLYTTDNAFLLPVYRFAGTATDSMSVKPINTTTIVSALP